MRVLHVGPMYAPVPGGGEQHLQALSEGLVARGHQVTVFTANVASGDQAWNSQPGGLAEIESINGVRVVRFDPRGGRTSRRYERVAKMRGGWRLLDAMLGPDGHAMLRQGPRTLQMIDAIRREPADVIAAINWYWPQAYHAHLATRFARVPLVGIPLFHTTQEWSARPLYDRMLARCREVMVSTSHEQAFALARGARRTHVVGVGVKPEAFGNRDGPAIRRRYGIGADPVVGFVGRQESNKGVATLIAALQIVWRSRPGVRLMLAGHSAPDAGVRAALERLGDAERANVVQVGAFADADKAAIVDAFDVMAMPSKEESFGIAYLEAWLCEKPVVGARIGSTACVIDDGRDGLLADPDDPADVARAIDALLADPGLRAQMGRSGREKTLANHTWTHVIDRAETLYRRAVGQR